MTTEVQICNLALSHLGDAATVASIAPPEGSAQAEHCALFYPIARDALLEMHQWGFCTRRTALAPLTNDANTWDYCYAAPTDMLNAIAVLDSAATDDNSVGIPASNAWYGEANPALSGGVYTPKEFVVETLADGTEVIRTNQPDAVLRYTGRITDPGKFSPLFVKALAASLASMLAGPVIKGDAGMAAAARWEMIAFGRDGKSGLYGQAAASDANSRRATVRDRQQTPWLVGR